MNSLLNILGGIAEELSSAGILPAMFEVRRNPKSRRDAGATNPSTLRPAVASCNMARPETKIG
jgi:hypothetical protein